MKVVFIMHHGECLAIFPNVKWNDAGDLMSYAHIGQHGACSPDLLSDCRKATPNEYKPLLDEMAMIYDDVILEVNNGSDQRI